MGVGSIAGALFSGWRANVSGTLLVVSAALFGLTQIGAAAAPTEWVQLVVLALVGAASVTFAAGVNSSLQLAAGEMRGRVMALYSVVFLGSTPIGAPIVGWIAQSAGPRVGLLIGGVAALGTAVVAAAAYRRADVALEPAAARDEHAGRWTRGRRAVRRAPGRSAARAGSGR
jgi:MFS family permease